MSAVVDRPGTRKKAGRFGRPAKGIPEFLLRFGDHDIDWGGRDAIGNNDQLAGAKFSIWGNVEIGGDHQRAGGDAHRTVIVSAAIEYVSGLIVADANQWVVGGILKIVPERCPLC